MASRYQDTTQQKPRKYQELWELIAKNTSDQPVRVRCPVRNQPRLIQAVRKEKSHANMLRKNVDAVGYGKLVTVCHGEWVYFSLKYNGDML